MRCPNETLNSKRGGRGIYKRTSDAVRGARRERTARGWAEAGRTQPGALPRINDKLMIRVVLRGS